MSSYRTINISGTYHVRYGHQYLWLVLVMALTHVNQFTQIYQLIWTNDKLKSCIFFFKSKKYIVSFAYWSKINIKEIKREFIQASKRIVCMFGLTLHLGIFQLTIIKVILMQICLRKTMIFWRKWYIGHEDVADIEALNPGTDGKPYNWNARIIASLGIY